MTEPTPSSRLPRRFTPQRVLPFLAFIVALFSLSLVSSRQERRYWDLVREVATFEKIATTTADDERGRTLRQARDELHAALAKATPSVHRDFAMTTLIPLCIYTLALAAWRKRTSSVPAALSAIPPLRRCRSRLHQLQLAIRSDSPMIPSERADLSAHLTDAEEDIIKAEIRLEQAASNSSFMCDS